MYNQEVAVIIGATLFFALCYPIYVSVRPIPIIYYADVWTAVAVDWMLWAMGAILDLGMIIGASIGYVAQLRDIQQIKSSQGFSTLLTFILMFSNTLRCFYWVGSRYDKALFLQAVLMIAVQIALLFVSIKYRAPAKRVKRNPVQVLVHKAMNFWNWDHFIDYVVVFTVFTIVIGIITIFVFVAIGNSTVNTLYTEMLGYISLSMEALLGSPQIWKNFRNKSTQGLSYLMIATWVLGDSFKLVYYTGTAQPIQFIGCAAIQLTADCIILLQIYRYRPPSVKRSAGIGHRLISIAMRGVAWVSSVPLVRFVADFVLSVLQIRVSLYPAGIMMEVKKEALMRVASLGSLDTA